MAMPRKRPFADINQYYAYIWKHNGEVIYVGYGKNNRARPFPHRGGKNQEFCTFLKSHWKEVEWEVIKCDGKEAAKLKEKELIANLTPTYNIAPGGGGGFKGMHTEEGLASISKKNSGRKMSEAFCRKRSALMKGNKNLEGHVHSEETRRKISETSKGRKPSQLCIEKSRQRMIERNKTAPPRKGATLSEETKKKLREVRLRYFADKQGRTDAPQV